MGVPGTIPALVGLTVGLAVTGCSPGGDRVDGRFRRSTLETVKTWMTGTFANHRQAADAPDEFHDTRLVHVPIWDERDDGPWIYVEQAHVGDESRPFVQRVYRLVIRPDGGVASEVYALPGNPRSITAPWRGNGSLGGVHPHELIARPGCTVVFAPQRSNAFSGAIVGQGCPSDLRGARYVTSDVTLGPDRILVWDRGFDGEGVQVWGSTSGPYRFRRQSTGPPE